MSFGVTLTEGATIVAIDSTARTLMPNSGAGEGLSLDDMAGTFAESTVAIDFETSDDFVTPLLKFSPRRLYRRSVSIGWLRISKPRA